MSTVLTVAFVATLIAPACNIEFIPAIIGPITAAKAIAMINCEAGPNPEL
ncbi:Unknown protein sequence [Pseudomonas syringae pv. syringae]|nr:Unknown protein sequence [Pseudomonas syringae pv. syringae]